MNIYNNTSDINKLMNIHKPINILCFGNSFTEDSISYVPFILQNIAPYFNINIYIALIGGCPLVQHCVNFTNETMTQDSTTYEVKKYSLRKYKYQSDKWTGVGSFNVDDILSQEKWDVITFQQAGSYADKDWATYYEPYIYKIHKALFDKINYPIKLGWLSIHGAYRSTHEDLLEHYTNTIENTKKIESLTATDVIFPYGTAVQNLRTTPLRTLGETQNLLADSGHIHDGIGCLTASYTIALKLLQIAGNDYTGVIGDTTRPTKDWVISIGASGTNFGETTQDVVGITNDNCYTAQVAAIKAIQKPYEVTDCNAFYTEPTN